MALTAATRSSSESIRVPSRSKMMSLMFLTGSGRNVRIIAFQYSHATFFWTCHSERSEASAFRPREKVTESPLVVAGQFPSGRRSGRWLLTTGRLIRSNIFPVETLYFSGFKSHTWGTLPNQRHPTRYSHNGQKGNSPNRTAYIC